MVTVQKAFDEKFWGSYLFDVVFQGDQDLFLQPEGVEMIEEFIHTASGAPGVGGILSYLSPLRPVARIPGDTDSLAALTTTQINDVMTVTQMGMGHREMDRLLVQDGSSARVRLFVSDADYQRAAALRDNLEGILANHLDGKEVTYHFSGDLPIAIEVVRAIVTNQLRSIAWVLVCITVLLLLVLRPVIGAVVVMVPALTANLLVFAVMGYAGLPIGIATSMFAAITIGVGVDYTLHLLHNYRKHRASELDHAASLRASFAGTGRAIRWNALVLAFLVLTFSAVHPNRSLGFLLSSAMIACYCTSILFLPALLRRLPIVPVLACLLLASPALATERQAEDAAPATAEEILLRLQDDFTRIPRIVRVEITTEYEQRGEANRVLWGVFGQQDRRFRVLYVFTHPEVSRGTALLMKLTPGGPDADSTWFYLPSFHSIRRVGESAYRLVVPGTGLSYGDARGFLPAERYDVALATPSGEAGRSDSIFLAARPKTEELRKNTGYDSLAIRVDAGKMLDIEPLDRAP